MSYFVKNNGNLPPQIVELMKHIVRLVFAFTSAIILMSCGKDDLAFMAGKVEKNQNSLASYANFAFDSTGYRSVNLTESFDLLLNPGKGFVKYYDYEAQYADKFTTIYNRYDWNDIQPQENQYNWAAIDYEIAQCVANGKKFAFGVMCANTNRSIHTPDKGKYVTPKWVFDAGAKKRTINATYWETGQTIKQVIPVWTDTTFIKKLNQFVAALGARYNGNSNIAFVDIRSYGNWGEQHLYELGGVDVTSNQLKTLFIQPYKTAFPTTQLINPWGETFYNDTYDWTVDNQIGMRSDGIFKYSNGSETTRAHQKAPSVFEYTADYAWLTSENYWNADTLLSYIEIGKPSYIQFDKAMYNANQTLYTTIANRMGYHFVLKNVQFPDTLKSNQSFNFAMSVLNKGVTNIYETCILTIALLDANDQVVQRKTMATSNAKNWNADQLTTEANQITFSQIQTGNYKLAIGMFSNSNKPNPDIKFANTNQTASNWCIITPNIAVIGTVE